MDKANNVKLDQLQLGPGQPLLLIAGTCVIESQALAVECAGYLAELASRLGMPFIYKSSCDKANRTSESSYRGPGFEQGLEILAEVKRQTGVAVVTDVHEVSEVAAAAAVVDMLQIPAFLCRQSSLIAAAAASGCHLNIKKGQFLSPGEMPFVVEKARAANGGGRIMVCERGACFGYNNLVVDMRSLVMLRRTGCPVIFDATHSVQLPGAADGRSGGQREFIPALARAAVACGISGLFAETHPQPDKALSDAATAWPLSQMEALLSQLCAVHESLADLDWEDE